MKGAIRLLLLVSMTGLAAAPARVRPPAKTHIVEMSTGGRGGRGFRPFDLVINQGDTVKFVLGSGGPHNVAFLDSIGEGPKRLAAVMPNQIDVRMGPILVIEGSSYTIPFIGVPAGVYPYVCIPHLSMGIMGRITVK